MYLVENPDVQEICKKIRYNRSKGKYVVSDLILEQNNETLQFVDLVMQGGGMLGIALVGYIYALEQADIRFLSIGGSSVGAIVSLLLSCCAYKTEKKGKKMANILSEMDMASFVDGGVFSSAFSNTMGSGDSLINKIKLALFGFLSFPDLVFKLGLNPGDKFLLWLTDELKKCNVKTLSEAQHMFEYMPEGLYHRLDGDKFTRPTPSLKIIAADITTGSKIVFPEMAPLYWENPENVNPALFVRASMSIPAFFQPMEVSGISNIVDSSRNWANLCSFKGQPPDNIMFSDGGLLSNFPISLFHKKRLPNAPTFGVRLGSRSRAVREVHTLSAYFEALFYSLRHYNDYDFIYQNPEYNMLITYIPTDGHNWLNFNMKDAEKEELFKRGVIAGYNFLETFSWERYKRIRFIKSQTERAVEQSKPAKILKSSK